MAARAPRPDKLALETRDNTALTYGELFKRSAQAAKDIKTLITNSFGEVQDGVALAGEAGSALREVVASVGKAAEVVAEIAKASSEQAGGLAQITSALAQIDQANQQNSALVEESAAAAKTLEIQAAAMAQQVGFFRIKSGELVSAPAESARRRAV